MQQRTKDSAVAPSAQDVLDALCVGFTADAPGTTSARSTSAAPSTIRMTIVRSSGDLLTKHLTLTGERTVSAKAAANLARGTFEVRELDSFGELRQILAELTTSEAICWGIPLGESKRGPLATVEAIREGRAPDGAIARSREHFRYDDGGPGVFMVDADLKDCPLTNLPNPLTISGVREVLVQAAPALADVPMLALPSASANVYSTADGECLRGLTGIRFYIPVARAGDIPEVGKRLHDRLVVAGFGFAFIAKSGAVHVRSPIDTAVWTPERLDYAAGAECGPGLEQRRGAPLFWNADGAALALESLPALDAAEVLKLSDIDRQLRAASRDQATAQRCLWAEEQRAKGRRVAATWTAAGALEALTSEHTLELESGEVATVADVLSDPHRYHNKKCADPLEPDYGGGDRRIACIYAVGQRSGPVIHSYAHGGANYFLRQSADSDFGIEPNTAAVRPATAYNRTDMGNAERFVHANRDAFRYVGCRWHHWDGRRWSRAECGEAERAAKAVVRAMGVEAFARPETDDRKKRVEWALRSESRERLNAMIDLAKPELSIRPELMDADPFLMTVLNGTLDLRTGQVRPHRPADLITKLASVHYDPAATCPRFTAFLTQILEDRELVGLVQRAVGYSLTGSNAEQVFFILHGSGANGKTTLLEVLRRLFGDYGAQAEFSTFLVRRGEGPRNDIARLRGARLVAATELRAGAVLDEAMVKSLTGGDRIAARFLHQEFFEFTPTFKIWLGANHLPTIRGDDFAIWRRTRIIPFTVTIPEEARDPALQATLAAELSGILNWAIDGCLAWQLSGLGVSPSVQAATDGYRSEMDWLTAFLGEHCLVAPGTEVRSSELYDVYRSWSKARGEIEESSKSFVARLATHDPSRIKKRKMHGGQAYWTGLELRAESRPVSLEVIV